MQARVALSGCRVSRLILCLGVLALTFCVSGQSTSTNFVGIQTNGPAVYGVHAVSREVVSSNFVRLAAMTNHGVRTIERIWAVRTNVFWSTNLVLDHLRPDSLNYAIWTNMVARTNGRDMRIWAERRHLDGWPNSAPLIKWNRKCVIYGLSGFTALSPCWEGEGSAGQVPITALTRRHGYTRGHGMGQSGISQRFAGKRVWFLTANDKLVEVKIEREAVRVPFADKRDYTIFLFDRDLPKSIEPLLVADPKQLEKAFPYVPGAPRPVFETEQGGHVSPGMPGLSVNTWKGGDSGSANMILLGDQLFFVSGRSTSGPSPEMQADMDNLCTLSGLNPIKYKMRWANLPALPH